MFAGRRLTSRTATRVATPAARRTIAASRAAVVPVSRNGAMLAGLVLGAGLVTSWALKDNEAEAAAVPVFGVPGTDKERTFIAVCKRNPNS